MGLSVLNLVPGKLGLSWSPRGGTGKHRRVGAGTCKAAASEATPRGLGFILRLRGMEDSNSFLM